MMIDLNETEQYSSDGAVCPYCGHLNSPQDCYSLYDECIEDFDCENCGKNFKISVYCSWSWTTEKR